MLSFLRLILPFLLISACQARTEIPAYLLPGASQELVRSSLDLTNCNSHKENANTTFCEVKQSKFAGVQASLKLTFDNDKLTFVAITMPASEFATMIANMTKIMGKSSNEREFEAHGVKHQTIYWGNKNLFVTLNKYAFGDTKHSMLILMLPETIPEMVRPLFLKNSEEKKP